MGPIEIMALAFAIMIILKLFVVLLHPKSAIKFSEALVGKNALMQFIFLALAVWTGYYIFQYFTIVDVAAIMLFTIFLVAVAFAAYWELFVPLRKKAFSNRGRMWLSVIIWLGLALWVLYALFV